MITIVCTNGDLNGQEFFLDKLDGTLIYDRTTSSDSKLRKFLKSNAEKVYRLTQIYRMDCEGYSVDLMLD
ncbi:hypothetical protein [Sphingobacterium suaedae]|uniref:Uncharacterized protein n=1 Tax=Sphingobacterium suaedae TaxID=1686402 RepID=A0ABW5KM51_9SPHI